MHQRICTECGRPFAAKNAHAKTCSETCRQRRYRRRTQNGDKADFAIEAGAAGQAMQNAVDAHLDDIPAIARAVVAEELRPLVREALTGEVLGSLSDMLALLPLAHAAIEETLRAGTLQFNEDGTPLVDAEGHRVVVADHGERRAAAALIYKYTIGQPGLAPQPDTPDQAPIQIVFPDGLAGTVHVDAPGFEEIDVAPGEKVCDVCHKAKAEDEFVAGSDRCYRCHSTQNERVRAAIEERTGEAYKDPDA